MDHSWYATGRAADRGLEDTMIDVFRQSRGAA